MPEHILVTSYEDLESASRPGDRDRQRIATVFSEQSWDYVVWIPEWLLEDAEKGVATVDASSHLAVGNIEDYSEKAWRLHQRHRFEEVDAPKAFLPKSSVVVFERGEGIEKIETPQRGLEAFADG